MLIMNSSKFYRFAMIFVIFLTTCVHFSLGFHRDYVYDIASENPQEFQDRMFEQEDILRRLNMSTIPASYAACIGNGLSYNVTVLLNCDAGMTLPECNVTYDPSTEEGRQRFAAAKELIQWVKDTIAYHSRFWPNVIAIVIKFIPAVYFLFLCIFTHHFDTKTTENPRLLDGSSAKGQRSYVYGRPRFNLWDGSKTPNRLVGLVQKFVVWRENVEGAQDAFISQRFVDSGFSPVPGTNFHLAANIQIPELDEDELTEAQALKRRIKNYGVMTRDQFRYNVEQIHARRLVLSAAKEYQRRVIERGDEPLFDAHEEATESMDCALRWSREERIANQLRIEAERRERDKTIDIQWEQSNKSFRDHRRRMREHQDKVDMERAERIAQGLPAIPPEQMNLI